MTDCLILGGGVIGLSLAYDLARHGAKVTVLDRGALGREASWAGAGILPAARFDTATSGFDQLAGMSSELHPRWAEELREATGIDNGYRRSGGIYLAYSACQGAALAAVAGDWQRQGIECRKLAAGTLADLEPALAVDRGPPVAAWHVAEEAQLRNPRHVRALVAVCERLGVELRPGVECLEIESHEGRATGVVTASGVIRGGSVCIAAGAWSGGLLSRLGVVLRVKPIRGQMVLFNCGRPLLRAVINVGSRYFVPRDDGRVLVGSTEEDAGFDARTTAEGIAGLRSLAAEIAPAVAACEVERTWAGLRPGSMDGRPYLGRVPGFENLFCAAGHFRGGLHLSPGTAVVMSRVIRGEPAGIELGELALDRA